MLREIMKKGSLASVLIPVLWLLSTRLLLIFFPDRLFLQTIHWKLLAEKVSDGLVPYKQIYDFVAPLAAYVYGLLYYIAPNHFYTLLVVLSTLLIIIQALIINQTFVNGNYTPRGGFLPAMVYIVASSFFPDSFWCSPLLMAITPFLVVISLLAKHIKNPIGEKGVFLVGLMLGISLLFSLQLAITVVVSLLIMLLYSATKFREYMLMLVGLLLPFIIVASYFYWHDAFPDFMSHYFGFSFTLKSVIPLSINYVFAIFAPLFVALLLAIIFHYFSGRNIIYFQNYMATYMLLLIPISFIIYAFSAFRFPFYLIFIATPFSFFVTRHLSDMRNGFLASLLIFALLLIGLLQNVYVLMPENTILKQKIRLLSHLNQKTLLPNIVQSEGKKVKILSLQNDVLVFVNNRSAGGFIYPSTAYRYLSKTNSYNQISDITQTITTDFPDMVYDKDGVFKKVLDQNPYLSGYFTVDEEEIFRQKVKN